MTVHYKMLANVVFAQIVKMMKLAVVPSQCWCMFRSRLAEKAEVYILVCIIVRIPLKLSPL